MLRDALIAQDVPAEQISVIPDEQEATAAALAEARPGDLVLIFGDNITRTWEQIVNFRPAETERRAARRWSIFFRLAFLTILVVGLWTYFDLSFGGEDENLRVFGIERFGKSAEAEGEDVGRLVEAAIVAVERLDGGIVGDDDADAAVGRRASSTPPCPVSVRGDCRAGRYDHAARPAASPLVAGL